MHSPRILPRPHTARPAALLAPSLTCLALSSAALAGLAPPDVEITPTGCRITWAGGPHTMFLQHSPDLRNWSFLPVIESGAGSYAHDLPRNGDSMFVRIKYNNVVVPEPESFDFDGDGLTSLFEVAHNLDPLVADSDGDGTPDGS